MSDVIVEGTGSFKLYRMTDNQYGLKLNGDYYSLWSKDGTISVLAPASPATQDTLALQNVRNEKFTPPAQQAVCPECLNKGFVYDGIQSYRCTRNGCSAHEISIESDK